MGRIYLWIDPDKIEMIPIGSTVQLLEDYAPEGKWIQKGHNFILLRKGEQACLKCDDPEIKAHFPVELTKIKLKLMNPSAIPAELLPLLEAIQRSQEHFPKAKLGNVTNGWKLHLNFNTEDRGARNAVESVLEELLQHGIVADYKIGKGVAGKEATVYVGDGGVARRVAQYLERKIGPLLKSPEGDSLIQDIPLTSNVMGRFSLGAYNARPEFFAYGIGGIPFFQGDVNKIVEAKMAAMSPGGRKKFEIQLHHPIEEDKVAAVRDLLLCVDPKELEPAAPRAFAELEKRFGPFFTGAFAEKKQAGEKFSPGLSLLERGLIPASPLADVAL